MPSQWSASGRFELQQTGENLNTWGIRLDTALVHIDFSIFGIAEINLSGGIYSLTTANGTDDEARASTLRLTGLGGTVIVPNVSKPYRVINDCSSAVVLSAGNLTVSVDPGDVVDVICDGVDVIPMGYRDSGGNLLSIKQYVDATAFSSVSGLPATSGNAGKFLYTNGSSWLPRLPVVNDISDFVSNQTALREYLEEYATEMALVL